MSVIHFNAKVVDAVTQALQDSSHDEQSPGGAFLQNKPDARARRTLAWIFA